MSKFNHLGHYTPDNDLEVLRALCYQPHQLETAIEVGAWAGQSTIVLAESFSRVFSIDTWDGRDHPDFAELARTTNVFDVWRENIGDRFLSKGFPCIGTSLEWARRWPFHVDLIFIDANHHYEWVRRDLAAWWPHVRPGGILCGHDASLPDVRAAIDEFGFDDKKENVWWKRKPL